MSGNFCPIGVSNIPLYLLDMSTRYFSLYMKSLLNNEYLPIPDLTSSCLTLETIFTTPPT